VSPGARPSPTGADERPRSARGLYLGGALIVVIAAGAVIALAAFQHAAVARDLRARVTRVEAGPRVEVATVVRSPGSRTLSLTGEAQPFLSVTLYSKVSGYLKDVRVDKGDHVAA